ncbi:MAG TPA: GntR family transcriptional regulator, partial [Pseudonocardia sp.]|nr:GntR family transcriptional regulator [Pseudonocardia sp.]
MAEPIDPSIDHAAPHHAATPVPGRAADPSTRPDSLSRQIYAALREGIIRGRYPQGSRLTEQRLAEELAVS